MKLRLLAMLAIGTLFVFASCSEEVYEAHTHSSKTLGKDEVSFRQFKEETGIKNFETLKSIDLGAENNRTIAFEFVIDTTRILKYIAEENGKNTYSFKIYPIMQDLGTKEYYNLVYEKNGTDWNEIIFKNKEKENPEPGDSGPESSEMVYNRQFSSVSISQFCEVITYTNANCNCLKRSECDWCEQCIRVTITYEYCPSPGGGSGSGTGGIGIGGPPGDGGGGSGIYTGIYIPNPYEPGDEDLNNPDFVLSINVAAFTRGLDPDLRGLMTTHYWLFPNIVDFMRNNGGVTQANKDAVVFALNHFKNFTENFNTPNWTFESMLRFRFWVFNHVLNSPNTEGTDVANELKTLVLSEPSGEENTLEFVTKAIDADLIYNDMDDDFLLSVDEYMDMDVAAYIDPTNPLYIHFSIQCAVLRANHPNWSDLKIYWEASKEMVHIGLDVLGLVPVVGEVADLTNGVLYTIEGDGVNATLSYASAVPVAGWAAVGVKYAVKVNDVTQTASTIAVKVKLTWKVLPNETIYFGSNNYCRSQLRKVLGLAVGNANQAHHIIPLDLQTNLVVQKAAKSGSAFHMNEALNGIPLPSTSHLTGHNQYNAKVGQKLTQLNAISNTPQEAYDNLVNFINQLKTLIQNNPNMNLGQIANLIN